MTISENERKGRILFCYAVALAARRLDSGDFRGLNCGSFLAHVEHLLELGVKEVEADAGAQAFARSLLVEVNLVLEVHEASEVETPGLRLVWSRPEEDQGDP